MSFSETLHPRQDVDPLTFSPHHGAHNRPRSSAVGPNSVSPSRLKTDTNPLRRNSSAREIGWQPVVFVGSHDWTMSVLQTL